MAVPNYTYLKLKMLGPNGVITVGSTFSHAYTCDHEHYELARYRHQLSRAPSAQRIIYPSSPRLQQANLLDCLPPT